MAYKLQLKRGASGSLPTGSAGEPLFTTDTNDLYIGTGAVNQRFQKYIASGTSAQFLKGDGSLDSTTYTPTSRTLTINGTSLDLSANRTFNVGTVTTAAATTGGQVAFFNGATVITSVSGLYFDGVDKLGIGTASPTYNLDVTGTARMTSSSNLQTLYLQNSGTGYGLYNQADSYFQGDVKFQSVTSTLLKVDASHKLIAAVAGTDYQAPITNPVTGTGTTNYLPKWTSGSALGNSLVYDNGTNVGINTTTFTYAATGRTNFAINGSSNTMLEFKISDVASAYLYSTTTDVELNAVGAKSILFSNNAAVRAKITDSGNFLLNSTSDNGNRLQVSGNGYFSGSLGVGTSSPISILSLGGYTGSRLPYINGTANTFNPNGITVTSANSGNTGIGGGLDLTNNIYSVGSYSPIISFSSLSSNSAFNNAYAGIWGVLGGQGTDANWVNGHLVFGTANSAGIVERFRIDANGNLGLGVTPSAWNSASYKVIELPYGATIHGQTDAAIIEVASNMYINNAYNYTYTINGYATRYRQSQGAHQWYNAPSGTSGNAITFTQAMTLTASGRLLLGTTTEGTYLLDVNGTGRFSSSVTAGGYLTNGSTTISIPIDTGGTKAYFDASSINGPALTVRADSIGRTIRLTNDGSGTVIGAIDANTTGLVIGTNTSHPIVFSPGATERARFTSGGNLLVGTSTDSGERLQVNGSGKFLNNLTVNKEDGIIGIDASNNPRIGFVKKSGFQPFLAFASEPFLLRVSSGTEVFASNTFTTVLSIATSGAATFSNKINFTPIATPSSPSAGDVYYDSTSNKLRCYNGTSWNDLF